MTGILYLAHVQGFKFIQFHLSQKKEINEVR